MLTILLVLLLAQPGRQPPVDFSGTWAFDAQKSMQPDAEGRVVLAAMLGDEFTALQTASSLTLRILSGGQLIVAVYDLAGDLSENVSPGEIVVTSRASWERDRLVILSTSTSEENGKLVTIQTTRTIWIDEAGDLIIERTGTPAALVTPSRSVYRRIQPGRRAGGIRAGEPLSGASPRIPHQIDDADHADDEQYG